MPDIIFSLIILGIAGLIYFADSRKEIDRQHKYDQALLEMDHQRNNLQRLLEESRTAALEADSKISEANLNIAFKRMLESVSELVDTPPSHH